jgi:hypothetical protein
MFNKKRKTLITVKTIYSGLIGEIKVRHQFKTKTQPSKKERLHEEVVFQLENIYGELNFPERISYIISN